MGKLMNEYLIKTEEVVSLPLLRHRIIMDSFANQGNVVIYKDGKVFGWRSENSFYPSFKLSMITDEFRTTMFQEKLDLLRQDFQSLSRKNQRKCIKNSIKILTTDFTEVTVDSTCEYSYEIHNKNYSRVLKVLECLLVDAADSLFGSVVNDLHPIEERMHSENQGIIFLENEN